MEHKDFSISRGLLKKAGELGLLSIDIPEAYGGLGLHKVSSAVVGEQFALPDALDLLRSIRRNSETAAESPLVLAAADGALAAHHK